MSTVDVDQVGYQILSAGEIRAEPDLVDLTIAVLAAIEQDHWKTVAELNPQPRGAR